MKMTLEVNEETLDRVILCSLKQTIGYLKDDVKKLKKKKKLDEYELRQLAEDVLDLDALERTFEYYGGNQHLKG